MCPVEDGGAKYTADDLQVKCFPSYKFECSDSSLTASIISNTPRCPCPDKYSTANCYCNPDGFMKVYDVSGNADKYCATTDSVTVKNCA